MVRDRLNISSYHRVNKHVGYTRGLLTICTRALLFFFKPSRSIYLNNIIFTTHNIITKLKIYGIKERNTAYKVIDNYILLIKIKSNLNQMKYLKHLPFLFKLADLICLKGYVFFCFIFDFQNFLEMIKDGNNSFTPTGPQIRFS